MEIDILLKTIRPYTLLAQDRMNSLIRMGQYLNQQKIEGDFVECGTYKGGSAALLSQFLEGDRHLWLYDSFQGMPETTDKDGLEAGKWVGDCLASPDDVNEVMALVGTHDSKFSIYQGWFQDTFQEENLPTRVALLHCDADWYDSVMLVLDTFYDRVVEGGCIILDDFGYWEGCREAFYDFCQQRGEKPLLERIGTSQAYWLKGRGDNRHMVPVAQAGKPLSVPRAATASTASPGAAAPAKTQVNPNGQVQSLQQQMLALKASHAEELQTLKAKLKTKQEKLQVSRAQAKSLRRQLSTCQEALETARGGAIAAPQQWVSQLARGWTRLQQKLKPEPSATTESRTSSITQEVIVPSSSASASILNPPPISPLTQSSEVTKLRTYPAARLIRDWKRTYDIDITEELSGVDMIRLYQCNQSQLRFFYPLNVFGSEHLYAQLETFDWYYMPEKWEYQVAVKDIRPSDSVLEVGSGYGFFIKYCQKFAIHAKGLETNSKAVAIAKENNLSVENFELENFASEQSESFDVVCSFQVLEHVPNPLQFLTAATQLLKKGGSLILCVPNANSFLKHQYCLLDMPPHHMHQWSEATFKYLENLLPLRLALVKYEPLASYHVSGYVESYGRHLRTSMPLGDWIFNSKMLSIYKTLLSNETLRSQFRGQSLYVRFIKL